MRIRLIKKSEIKDLIGIYINGYKGTREKWVRKTADSYLNYLYKRQKDLFFVAVKDNKIVGAFVETIKPWWDGNHLTDGEFFVDRKYQKQGIGTALLARMARVAIQKYNIKSIDFATFKGRPADSWYKKIGFKEDKDLRLISGDPRKLLSSLRR